jgi:hypothetical protein
LKSRMVSPAAIIFRAFCAGPAARLYEKEENQFP